MYSFSRNEHHRKLRAHFGDISDWLVNADVSDFCRSLPCVTSCASHDYLLPPTTPCCPQRLPAASHDYLLRPTTASLRPSLMITQNLDDFQDIIRKSTC